MTSTVAPVVELLSGPTGRLVSAHRVQLREVLRRHGIRSAGVFGSVARGEDHEGSDVDLLVDFPPGIGLFAIAGIQAELEDILGVEVDLVSQSSLKDSVRARVEPDLIAL
ncbi:MAG: nucleotidyltransferase family protein [Dermatophilaceae bacterium]